MRLLVACPKCKRQYDASTLKVGQRFRCHCGTAIRPESTAGTPTNLICPACGPEHTLVWRAWSDISVSECNRCAGVWLSNESFRYLMDQTATESFNPEARENSRYPREPEVE